MSLNCFRNDITSLEKLIKSLWLEAYNTDKKNIYLCKPHSYRKIENKCEEIAYNLVLAHWLSRYICQSIDKTPEERRHTRLLQLLKQYIQLDIKQYIQLDIKQNIQVDGGLYPEANEIFLILEGHSLLSTLKNMLKDLNIDELLHELDSLKPILSRKLCCFHENNYNILIIYSIVIECLNVILLKVSQKKLDDSIYEDFTDVLKRYIEKITKIDYLLILFENLLKIMLLKLKFLKFFSKNQGKFTSTYIRKSRDNYLINKKLGLCIFEIVDMYLKKDIYRDVSQFSEKRRQKLMRKIHEYQIKTNIVYNSNKLITSHWKNIQNFKRINLKGQEDFDESFGLRYDLIFKNKKLYASYYMNYMEFDAEYLLKLALANNLFKEATLLIDVFQMHRKFIYSKEIVEIFAYINEKADEILEGEMLFENKGFLYDVADEENYNINTIKPQRISSVITTIRANFLKISSNQEQRIDCSIDCLLEDETFKFLADFTLTSEISLKFVPILLKETFKYMYKSQFLDVSLVSDYFNRMILLVEHNLNNQQVPSSYTICSLISDTKNIENLSVEPALLLEHLSQKTSEKQMLLNLSEKLRNQSELSGSLTHAELNKLIQSTIEILSKKTEENSYYSITNFVKLFLKYLLDLGNIMKQALARNLDELQRNQVLYEFNYGLLLLIDPKTIISIMIFLLKCENESVQIAQLMRVNILDVILNQNYKENLNKSTLLPLFNVRADKKQEDFRVKNRIVGFIFEMERQFNEYKFLFVEGKYVELPIFSVLALLTQDLTPITKANEVIYIYIGCIIYIYI